MLNYLGPSIGANGPIATQLPAATPGTIPDGVPGVPSNVPPPSPRIHLHHAAQPAGPPPAHALAAILRHAHAAGQESMKPKPPEYATTTQSDGSILLHAKNHDGSKGPVVKVINAIKRADDKKA